MIGEEFDLPISANAHFVGIIRALGTARRKPIADLNAFNGVDAHQSCCDFCVQLGGRQASPIRQVRRPLALRLPCLTYTDSPADF